MIYLDNSATSYPKPQAVVQSVSEAFKRFGGNSGRGAYRMALETTEQIYFCRKKLAEMFGASSVENVVLTYNCTAALNMAIKGLAKTGAHFIISDLEHNAVLRPLSKLKKDGIAVTRKQSITIIKEIKRTIFRNNKSFMTHGSFCTCLISIIFNKVIV